MPQFDAEQKEFWSHQTNLRPYDHPIVQTFVEQRLNVIRNLLGDVLLSSGLEIGCGDGFGTLSMQPLIRELYGCDISLAMLRNNPIECRVLCQADAYSLPFQNRSFDVVYCWELLHHIDNPLKVIKEMARVSRKYLLIFEPNSLNVGQALFGLLVPSERGTLRFTPWYFKNLLLEAGLRPVQILTGGCFTPNRTPEWVFNILKRLPYKWPLVGISNIALMEVP